jgi:hypothetical protein
MNGTVTNKNVIFIIIVTLALNATIGLSTLAYCLVMKIEPNQVLLTAFISIITGLLGIIGGMLTKTSPTETTKQPLPNPPTPPPTNENPTPVEVVNAPTDPVPTVDTPK